jgi:hypothetical protein
MKIAREYLLCPIIKIFYALLNAYFILKTNFHKKIVTLVLPNSKNLTKMQSIVQSNRFLDTNTENVIHIIFPL